MADAPKPFTITLQVEVPEGPLPPAIEAWIVKGLTLGATWSVRGTGLDRVHACTDRLRDAVRHIPA